MKSLGISLLAILPLAAAQCSNDTHAQLKVAFTITEDEFNQNLFGMRRLAVRPSGNVGTSTYEGGADYDYYEYLADFEACVPREGACLEVTVSDLPTDSYEISWDGDAVATGAMHAGEFGNNITSTEVGDYCSPVCEEEAEALFEYQYWSSIGFEDYRVEDAEGETLFGCDNHQGDCQGAFDSMHAHRECLPRDGCYRYLVGDNFHRIPLPGATDAYASHSLRWDGKQVDKAEGKLFDSILFGNGCPKTECAEEESLVELFVHRATSDDACAEGLDLSWELRLEEGSWSRAASGAFPGCADTSLYHEAICVPKERCAMFVLTSSAGSEYLWPLYSLTRDGVVYRRKELNLDYDSPDFAGLEETTFLGGDECASAVEAVCAADGEAVMAVDVVAPAEYDLEGTALPAIPGGLDWDLRSTSGAATNYSLPSGAYFDRSSTELGAVHRTVACVPGDVCLEFRFDADFEAEYAVERNGAELVNQVGRGDSYDTTPFGCSEGEGGGGGDGGTGGNAATTASIGLAGVLAVLGSLLLG